MEPGTVKAIVFLVVLGAIGISSWLITRKARRVLGRALGREIRDGEETSLKAWMSVPDAQLRTAAEEMAHDPIGDALEKVNTFDNAVGHRPRKHDPDGDYPSIR